MAVIKQWGNSLGIRLPSNIVKETNVEDGVEVRIINQGRRIIIEPKEQEPTLDELLDQITPENLHESTDVDAMGKERL